MAGQEIYIGKMIESLQDGMNSMEEKMDTTVSVLQNILINTGLTKKQKTFTGEDLTTASLYSPAYLDLSPYQNTGVNPNFEIETEGKLSYYTGGSTTGYSRLLAPIDFSEFETLTFDFGNNGKKTTFSFRAGEGDDLWSYEMTASEMNSSAEIDISTVNGIFQPQFKVDFDGNNVAIRGSFRNITFHRPDGTTYTLLQAAAGTLSYQNNEIVPSAAGGAYGYVDYADLMTSVATWDSLIFSGNLDGVTLSLVDEDGNAIMPLSQKNDISTLSIYTGFFVKYEMTNADSFVSGVIFRYF